MKKIAYFIVFLFIFSCNPVDKTRYGRVKENVIKYYEESGDTEKIKASKYLLEGACRHDFYDEGAIDVYRDKIMRLDIPCRKDSLTRAWEMACAFSLEDVVNKCDTTFLDEDFLRENIDEAFAAWRNAPWHEDVPFDLFCEYILPYRVSDERLQSHTRRILREKYQPLIENCTDLIEAFEVVYNYFMEYIQKKSMDCPYIMDPLTTEYVRQADCKQRCILIVSVLRALGIPATIDRVLNWANYSTLGHEWVVLVDKDGQTYSIADKDSVAQIGNPVDAATFEVRYVPKNDEMYGQAICSQKKVAKVYRQKFLKKGYRGVAQSVLEDVSGVYGFDASLSVELHEDFEVRHFYLCTFLTGKGWVPVAVSTSQGGKIRFDHVGQDIIYLVGYYNNNEICPVANPVWLKSDGKVEEIIPDITRIDTINLFRKYPVTSIWAGRWGDMIGSTIEGSQYADFREVDTLCLIEKMPCGRVALDVDKEKKYRYVRYRSARNEYLAPLKELMFFESCADTVPLSGTPVGYNVLLRNIHYAFDRDLTTVFSVKSKSKEYWVGLDLQTPKKISSVVFFPKNDDNDIVEGELYELFYYDKEWRSVGSCIAQTDSLMFSVPHNSLLWLRDLSKGKEERIFLYREERQIWF